LNVKEFIATYLLATVAAAVAYAVYGHLGLSVLVLFGTVGAIVTGWVIGEEIKIRIDARLRAHYAEKSQAKKSEVW
jgi:hypothetical protein